MVLTHKTNCRLVLCILKVSFEECCKCWKRKGISGSLIPYVLVLFWKYLIVLQLGQLFSLVKEVLYYREVMALKV